MYDDHVPVIMRAMQSSPDIFARGIMFAVLSARVQFPKVPDQMKCVKRNGDQSPALWSWKMDAFNYVEEHKQSLFGLVAHETNTRWALEELCRIPGLGIVKGAFVLQMLGHDIACLDVRNIERENLNPRAYRSDGKARKIGGAFRRKIARYVAQTKGRAQELWNVWCEDVAADYGFTAEQISAMHVDAIVPRSMREIPEIPF